jgi:hypothetical protein
MKRFLKRSSRRLCGCAVVLATVALAGCQRGEEVTPESLREARRQWERAGVRDYNLQWKTSGARAGQYRVFVRGGEVRSVRLVQDGAEREARPGDKSYYGIEGLFRVIDEELAQRMDERPFGQPKGSRVLLRMVRDPRYGFPRQYQRDVAGSIRGLVLDVVEFVPDPPAEIPPIGTGEQVEPPSSDAAR